MMKSSNAVTAATILCVLALASAGTARAQTCLGIPTADGQYAIAGGLGFADGSKSFGLHGTADLAGPFAVAAEYSLTTFDEIDPNGNTFSGSASYDLPLAGSDLAACPTTGIGYRRISDEVSSISRVTIPFGIGLGTTLEGDNGFTFMPFAVPQFQYIRQSASFDGSDEDDTDSATEFATALGSSFSGDQFYVTVAAFLTTIENSDPSFSITVGVITP